MKKPENPFRIFYDRAYDYFTATFVRKVFFFSLVVILVLAIVLQFTSPWLLQVALILAAAVCALATFVDSIQGRRVFAEQIKEIEADFVKRKIEKEGAESLAGKRSVFSAEESKFVRKKKWQYRYIIIVKFFFVVAFVAFFVTML